MTSPETVDCHVLVIGAGGAGVRAAIEASRYGETVLLSKAIAGKGGCTPMAEGGYNAVLRAQDSIEPHLRETLESGAFLNDPILAQTLVRNACTTAILVCRAALLRGESRGAHMRTDADAPRNEERSLFGHTFLSLSREGIERRDRP